MTTDETAPSGNEPRPLPFDTTKAHQARGYDYLLGSKDNIDADLRDTDTILDKAGKLLNFTQPVAITLISIMQ